MKEQRPCESPEHHENCSGVGSTKDHFTPKCISKILGWSREKLNSEENIQWLSPACHKEKDKDTPIRKEVLKMQLEEGFSFDFETHRAVFNGEITPKEVRMSAGKDYHLQDNQSQEHQ